MSYYFRQIKLMISLFLLGYSLITANFSIASIEHSKMDENDSTNISDSLFNNQDKNSSISSAENNNQSFEASEIRSKRDEDDDTPLHDEEMDKSDISSFNSSFAEENLLNNSKEKNANVKRSVSKSITSSSEKKHQKNKREAEEISKNESGSSNELKNGEETSSQLGEEETESKQINNPTIMTDISRNKRVVGGLAHRSRGSGQKGQQQSQAGRGPKSEGID